MWTSIVLMIKLAVENAFEWFRLILKSADGASDTILSLFVILALSRFLLGPLLGASFSGQSDKASIRAAAKQQRINTAAKQYNKDR